MNGKLDLTIRSLKHSLEMFENYKNNKDGKSDIWKEIMLNAYTRTQHYIDLKMNLLELMKIYGTHIARMYWRLIGDLQITSSMYSELDERNIHEFAKFVEEGLFQAEELKKMIEPLGSNRPD